MPGSRSPPASLTPSWRRRSTRPKWERWIVADGRGYAFVARLAREIVARDLVTAGQRQRILLTS